jgi:hypothetical protein
MLHVEKLKNAKFHADFKSVEKMVKNVQKKVLAKTRGKYALFPLFLVRQTCFAYNFFL